MNKLHERAAPNGAVQSFPKPTFRDATKDDGDAMAQLINFAGEGLPAYLWQDMIEGNETVWDVGRRRAQRDEGGFSYRNTTLACIGDEVVGSLVGYAQPNTPEAFDPADVPAMFVPMIELENLAPGSWYINVLAVFPEFRNRGVGSELIARAERNARQAGKLTVSIIASDGNPGAVRLYQRHGYTQIASRRIVKDDWKNPGENWVLLIKEI